MLLASLWVVNKVLVEYKYVGQVMPAYVRNPGIKGEGVARMNEVSSL